MNVEVERFNYLRKDSDCKDVFDTNVYVSSQFNLCAKKYLNRGQQIGTEKSRATVKLDSSEEFGKLAIAVNLEAI